MDVTRDRVTALAGLAEGCGALGHGGGVGWDGGGCGDGGEEEGVQQQFSGVGAVLATVHPPDCWQTAGCVFKRLPGAVGI